nr:retrovirus-related Pol polyprotein from transposon TNT 1-94 [Tanacetum cinerariifolium]
MTGNLKLLCNFVEKFRGIVHFGNDQFALILGYRDSVQGNVTINRVYYVEGLNHNLFSVGQFCDANLEVAFRKSTCFVRDLHGNDLLTVVSKKDIVIGLPKLKYVKDQLCSSCELSKAKRSSFKSKVVPSSKGRLNLLHMDLCSPMRVASINGKKYILVIVDDYSRYTWTLFLCSNDETPEVLKEFLTMIQTNLQVLVITVRTDRGMEYSENLDKMKEKGDPCILVEYSTQSKGYHAYNKRTKLIVESIHIRFAEIKEVSETYVAIDTSGLVPQRLKASDYDNPDPIPQRQDVSSLADTHIPSQQELDLLFGPLYDEFFNAGSNPQDKQPLTNIQPTSAPSTPTYVHVEENKNDQAEEEEQLPEDEFTNPSVLRHKKLLSLPHTTLASANKVTPCNDPKMCMYELTVSTAEVKNIKEAMADSAWIEAMQEELHQKALYGLNQAPRAWYDELLKFQTSKGFTKDADHAGCIDSRKSTSRGIQFLGDKLVSWMPKKQNCIVMSLAEAEYIALSASCAQVMWMRTQLKDYGFNYNKIPLYCDSQSAIEISCNPVQHSRIRHIHTRYHFIKEHVENGITELYFVRTEYQLANMFTKALPEDRFKYLVR